MCTPGPLCLPSGPYSSHPKAHTTADRHHRVAFLPRRLGPPFCLAPPPPSPPLRHVCIKGRPCKIVDYSTSKTGKHGHAKANIVGIDIFTGKKLEEMCPTSHNLDVPNVLRNEFQVPPPPSPPLVPV